MLDGRIIRGTTPIHSYELSCNVSDIQELSITYSQKGKTVIKKKLSDCTKEENIIRVKLEQEETLAFIPNVNATAQIKALIQGQVVATDEYILGVKEILDTEVFE